jgi:uncharacterized iron-regulated membrane protein
MKFSSVLFWLHLCAGVLAGSVIFVMSVTGALLTFQQTVLRTIERSQRYVEVPAGATRVPLEQMIASVRQQFPDAEITTVTFEPDPRSAVAMAIGAQGTAFVNPYTGIVLGTGSATARGFYRSVTSWHRYLAMSGDARATGRAITGACNAAFLVLGLSGLYLWWPRQWSWRHLRPVVWFRGGLRGKARDFNWHNAIGLWCAPVIIVLTTTGMVISYPWASNLVYTLTGSPRPGGPGAGRGAGPGGREGGPGRQGGARGDEAGQRGGEARRAGTPAVAAPAIAADVPPGVPLDELVAGAARQIPTWSSIALRLPARPGAPASATIADGAYWNRFARSTLTLNSASGAVVRWEPYSANSAGQKLRGWMRFAHTGELGGLAGEFVAGLVCLGGAFLVYTGLALSLRRLLACRTRARSKAGSADRPRPAGFDSPMPEPTTTAD